MKTFDNEWIFQAFERHPSFFTKRMSGGPAAYLFGRQKWLYIDTCHDEFERTMERAAQAIAKDDPRFGIRPRRR